MPRQRRAEGSAIKKLVGALQRREAARFMKDKGEPENRACGLVRISRSSFRYVPHPRDNVTLTERIKAIADRHKRYGYRRAWALLRRDGMAVNHKRVRRIWVKEGLVLPRRRPRKRRRGSGEVPCKAVYPNHVWTYDFIHDACENGRKLKMLTVEDEFTRECVRIEPDRSIRSDKVVRILELLFEKNGAPMFIRSDNGPEFIANKVKQRLMEKGAGPIYIDPGSPWQNAYEESFHSRLRDECLNMEVFHSVAEAKVITEMWRREYNEQRPHSSLNYMTPLEFKADWEQSKERKKMSLSLSGIPDGQGSATDSPEKERQSKQPCPSVYPPASALRSLSSVALSPLRLRTGPPRRQKLI